MGLYVDEPGHSVVIWDQRNKATKSTLMQSSLYRRVQGAVPQPSKSEGTMLRLLQSNRTKEPGPEPEGEPSVNLEAV